LYTLKNVPSAVKEVPKQRIGVCSFDDSFVKEVIRHLSKLSCLIDHVVPDQTGKFILTPGCSTIFLDSRLPTLVTITSQLDVHYPLVAVTIIDALKNGEGVECTDGHLRASLSLLAQQDGLNNLLNLTIQNRLMRALAFCNEFPPDPGEQETVRSLCFFAEAITVLFEHNAGHWPYLLKTFLTNILELMQHALQCETVSIIVKPSTGSDFVISNKMSGEEPFTISLFESDPTDEPSSSSGSLLFIPLQYEDEISGIIRAVGPIGRPSFSRSDLSTAEAKLTELFSPWANSRLSLPILMNKGMEALRLQAENNTLQRMVVENKSMLQNLERILNRREQELSAIYRTEGIVKSTLSIEKLLTMINKLIMHVVRCDKASVLLLDDTNGDLLVTGSQNIADRSDYLTKRLKTRGPVTCRVLTEKKTLFVNNKHMREGLFTPSERYRTNSFVSIPVYHDDTVKAILNVTDKWNGKDFDLDEIRLLEFMGAQISKSIARFRMTQELVHNEQVKRELTLAANLQQNIIPKQFPQDTRIDTAAYYMPAREMGGDLYDVFLAGPDKLILVMADVTGKGIPAAFYMGMVKSFIRALALKYVSPLIMLRILNRFIIDQNPTAAMYVTMFLGVLQLNTGTLLYASSGHEPPLLFRSHTNQVKELPASGLILGYLDDLLCQGHRIKLMQGDTLLLFTDGLIDTRNTDNKPFERNRLMKLFADAGKHSPTSLISSLIHEVDSFRGENDPFDDLAVMALRYRP